MKLHRAIFLLAALSGGFLLPSSCRADGEIFWEAESALNTNMVTDGPSRPVSSEEAEKLSGGAWLNGKLMPDDDREIFADYVIKVAAAGNYHFFVRKFWQHGAFRWRIDGGNWHDVRKVVLIDSVTMREYIPVNWVYLDDVTLDAGDHKVRIEVVNDPNYEFSKAYGFDCFLLTQGQLGDYLEAHPGIKGDVRH